MYTRTQKNNEFSVAVVDVVFFKVPTIVDESYRHFSLLFRPAAATKKLNDKFQKSHGRRSWLSLSQGVLGYLLGK